MFARRNKVRFLDRFRDFFWPRIGFRRALSYLGHRLARLPGTPYAIAGGFAWGAAISFTPFVGLHFILAGIGAWATRCGIIASAIGTAVGNPWTFPFIWPLIYQLGGMILRLDKADRPPPLASLQTFFNELWTLIGNWAQWLFGLKSAAEFSSEAALEQILTLAQAVFWPMLVGSVPAFIFVWIAFYIPIKYLVQGYQSAHRRRVHRARKKREVLSAEATDETAEPPLSGQREV